jgi:glucose-6-phosphate-specific signal transduction histidine kinase
MQYRLQYNVGSMLIVTAVIAVIVALCLISYAIVVLPLALIPFCYVVEKLLYRKVDADVSHSVSPEVDGDWPLRQTLFVFLGLSTGIVALISVSSGTPEWWSPFPLLVIIPIMMTGFSYGLQYQGAGYTGVMLAINIGFMATLWGIAVCFASGLQVRMADGIQYDSFLLAVLVRIPLLRRIMMRE